MGGRPTTRTAFLMVALAAIFGIGCGSGGSLVGNDDAVAIIAFDAGSPMDARVEVGVDVHTDLVTEATDVPANCVDRDHDGFGQNCSSGPDCNDNDPT